MGQYEVLELLKTHGSLTAKQLKQITGRVSVTTNLAKLVKYGKVTRNEVRVKNGFIWREIYYSVKGVDKCKKKIIK